MKKNITINLCGRLYQIDEDAYDLLSHYTETLRNYFIKQEGESEIADDIEQRISELFDERLAEGKEAIVIEDVQDIIEQIGNLKEITGEGENGIGEGASEQKEKEQQQAGSGNSYHVDSATVTTKKFYRDTANGIIFGVLAGAAKYFNSTPSIMRWSFVVLSIFCCFCTIFIGMVGFGPLAIPFCFVPVLTYIILGIAVPAADTPEAQLKMKGIPVTPQNLTTEVKQQSVLARPKEDVTGWNIFLGICATLLAVISAINFMGIAIAGGFAQLMVHRTGELGYLLDTALRTQLILATIFALLSFAIVIWCSIHAALSQFKKVKPMSMTLRGIWIGAWLLCVIICGIFIGISINKSWELNDEQKERSKKEQELWKQQHTHDGFVINDDDWAFFQKKSWKLIKSENTDRYTDNGEYMDGNPETRYIGTDGWSDPVIVTVERIDSIQPGTYKLVAAVRAKQINKFIYAILSGEAKDSVRLTEIPITGDQSGTIFELANMMLNNEELDADTWMGDQEEFMLTQEMLSGMKKSQLRKIAEANYKQGYGWTYICIPNIVVTEPTTISYGLTTDEDLTGAEPLLGCFSATDFMLIKQ